MAKKLTNKALIKKLESMTHEQLVTIISDLFKTNKTVETSLNLMFLEETYASELVEKNKKKLAKVFNSPRAFSLEKAKAILSEFSVICKDTKWYGDLALYYAQCATEFTMMYGDMNEKFYDALADAYENAIMFACEDEELYNQWKDRLEYVYDSFSGIDCEMDEFFVEQYYSIPWVCDE